MNVKRCSVLLFVLVLALGSVVPALAGSAGDANDAQPGVAAQPKWPSLGGGFSRSGQSGDIGPLTGGVRWKFETRRGRGGQHHRRDRRPHSHRLRGRETLHPELRRDAALDAGCQLAAAQRPEHRLRRQPLRRRQGRQTLRGDSRRPAALDLRRRRCRVLVARRGRQQRLRRLQRWDALRLGKGRRRRVVAVQDQGTRGSAERGHLRLAFHRRRRHGLRRGPLRSEPLRPQSRPTAA